MSSYIDFVSAGEKFGFTGSELKDWADKQFADYEKKIIENERKKIEEEERIERKKIEEEERLDRREKEKFDREMRLLERKAKIEQETPTSSGSRLPHAPNFKFTPFNEKNDQLDTFFQHFEMQCSVFGVKEKERAAYLISLFSGQTREAFLKLPTTASYSEIKTALLQRFNLTTNDYRKKFFSSVPHKDENISSYSQRLSLLLDKWIDLSKTDHEFDSLKDLLLRHRVLDSCNQRLTCFLLEREPSCLKELEDLSLKYFSAHENESLAKSNDLPFLANSANQFERGRSFNRHYQRRSVSQGDRSNFRYRQPKGGKDDDKSKSKENSNDSENTTELKNQSNEGANVKHDRNFKQRFLRSGGIRCYKCSGFGHVKADCPSTYHSAYVKTIVNESQNDLLQLPDSFRIDFCENFNDTDRDQHIYKGLLLNDENKEPVRVLRDTGSMIHAVHKDLVCKEDYTGEQLSLITFGGKIEQFSLAKIHVDTPFLSGQIVACVLEDYPEKHRCYDLLIGNGSTLGSPRALDPSPQVVEEWDSAHRFCFQNSVDENSHCFVVTDQIVDSENVISQRDVSCSSLVNDLNANPVVDTMINVPNCIVNTNEISDVTDVIANEPHIESTAIESNDSCNGINTTNVSDTVHKVTECVTSNQVTTRAQTRQMKSTKLPLNENVINFDISHDELIVLQKQDKTLEKYYKLATNDVNAKVSANGSCTFALIDGLLVRQFKGEHEQVNQILVPQELRPKILCLAHDMPFSAHMGIKRTLVRITSSFYWPGITTDVKMYCKSCNVCQKKRPKGRTMRAPLQNGVPLIDRPFQKCAIDLIGPLPMSENKNLYVLTLIDYATRWVEAIPLRDITSQAVSEALLTIFARVGLPEEILSDGGPQFVSQVMELVLQTLGIKHSVSTPYHPQTNGLCERVNGTIKSLIQKVATSNPSAWDRYLPCVLFAYREIPQETTQFSPFELVYGRLPRGPLSLVKDLWLNTTNTEEQKTTVEYVIDLRDRISKSCSIASKRTEKQMDKSKQRYDLKAKHRTLKENDLVLLFLPCSSNKIVSEWRGPYKVVEVVSPVNYKIDIDGRIKTYHVNMLQEYIARPPCLDINEDQCVHDSTIPMANVSIVNECEVNENESENDLGTLSQIVLPPLEATKSVDDVNINPNLEPNQVADVKSILHDFKDIFTDLPGCTNLVEHEIELLDDKPVKLKPYPLPFTSEEIVNNEVDNMLKMGIVQNSNSPYSSPIVLVKKKDGKTRFCIDFRRLNLITVGNAQKIPDPDQLFTKLRHARYLTKIDLTKGYWQIKIAEDSQKYTAFMTDKGLYEFVRMPFGLKNAPATFNGLMFKLLKDKNDALFFFDDIISFHFFWEDHVIGLRNLFTSIRSNGLTCNPPKVYIGFSSLVFVGHQVGNGVQSPITEIVDKILCIEVPKTKKHVKSIIGLVNYYSKFVPNIASTLVPLHNLTAKGMPDKVLWNEQCQSAIEQIKEQISSHPILLLPDLKKPFFVQTDASGVGLGAVLLQEQDGLLYPCLYASKKLLDRETRYSVIERECLAIVWALQKFARYLLGRRFVLQTDHRPLQFLNSSRLLNARLARWALLLQEFDFSVEHIQGCKNNLADFLSRF